MSDEGRGGEERAGPPRAAKWSPLFGVTSDAQAIVYSVRSIKWIMSGFKMVGCCLHSTLTIRFI
jgi:hypothetical protein